MRGQIYIDLQTTIAGLASVGIAQRGRHVCAGWVGRRGTNAYIFESRVGNHDYFPVTFFRHWAL